MIEAKNRAKRKETPAVGDAAHLEKLARLKAARDASFKSLR